MENASYSKNSFYFLVSLGITSVVGGLYFIYKSFSNNNPHLKSEIKKANTSAPINNKPLPIQTNKTTKVLTKELGLEIFNKITFAYEDYVETTDTIHHKRTRMSFMNNMDEYARLCGVIVAQRNSEYIKIRERVLKEYGVSETQYQDFLGQVTMLECEISLFSNYKPKLQKYPDANTAKEAFILFAETMITAHERYSTIQQQELRNYYLLFEKLRIEDEIYLKYGLSYFNIKYFIHEYNLFEDKKVQDYYYILPLLK
jgi:hypothetical protein